MSAPERPQVQTCVALDLETTGLSPETDDIIEVGAIKFRGSETLDTFSTLVNPLRPIPPFVQALTGIAPRELATAPPFAAIAGDLQTFVGAHPVVGHNIGFDLGFLQRKGLRLPGPAYDTFDLASALLPNLPHYSLVEVSRSLGVREGRPHRAVNDADMARGAFLKLVEVLRALDPAILAEIRRIADRTEWPLRHLFREVAGAEAMAPLQMGEPGLEGLDLHALAERLSVGPPLSRKGPGGAVDVEAVRQIFGAEGPLVSILGGFEPRTEQVEMAAAVAQAFNDDQHLIVEAGTGTGKSLAYLVPAALFGVHTGERVVVSTNTINLQEQLTEKDIPDALSILEAGGDLSEKGEFRSAVLKGRGNYLCLRRWAALKKGDSLTEPEAKVLIKVLLWLQTTATGDRGEVNLTFQEAALWHRLSAEGSDDQRGPCPFARRGLCFYHAARQRAEAAHLVVVNHALLTLDVRHGNLLPEHTRLIVDEAHNLEEVATNQLGFGVDDEAIDEFLARITGGTPASGAGLLAPFRGLLRAPRLGEGRRRDLAALIEGLEADVQNARGRLTVLFRLLSDFATKRAESGGDYEVRLRLTGGMRTQPDWSKVEIAWEDVDVLLKKVSGELSRLSGSAEQLSEEMPGKREDYLLEVTAVGQLGEQLRQALASAVASPEGTEVYWLSIRNRDGTVRLHSAPLHVGPIVKEHIFDRMDTVVLTGATLSTEGTFEYIKERLQLEPAAEVRLGSPFDYERLALLYIPNDMPEPNDSRYQAALESTIGDVARAAHGRTMVLFTSRSSLRNTWNGLRDPLAGQGITVLGQGIDGTPRQLLETFKSTPNVVLLGTGSFWEGVDIAGEALSVLVIARLPFGVPTEPLVEARSQQFEDPFSHYTVPQAVLRFKQGFGRLIRRKTDRGVLAVLDRRVFSKAYGAAFLDSVPRCSRRIGPARELAQATVSWLSQQPLA